MAGKCLIISGANGETVCGADLPSWQPREVLALWVRAMFLRAKVRKKDGKEHRYFSVVENRRVGPNVLPQLKMESPTVKIATTEGSWTTSASVTPLRRRSPFCVGTWSIRFRFPLCATNIKST